MAQTTSTSNVENPENASAQNADPVNSTQVNIDSGEDAVDGVARDHWITTTEQTSNSRFNFRNLNRRHGQWTCFVCCHVRTGTIIIGFWHMLLELMALSLITIAVVNPEMLTGQKHASDRLSLGRSFRPLDVQSVNCTGSPCLLAAQGNGHHRPVIEESLLQKENTDNLASDYPMVLRNIIAAHRINSEDVNVGIFITICMFVVTLLLVYGAVSGQPSHLMPFFFLQVFDFCIASMTMVGYLAYLPNVRQIIKDFPVFPLQQMMLSMNTKCLILFVMLMCLMTFTVKAYCISIIWRCYKFLMLVSQRERCLLAASSSGPVDQESQTLVLGHDLPDYNTAMTDPQYRKKISGLYPDPPPSYDMAMAALFSQTVALPPEENGTTSSGDSSSSTVPLLHPSRAGPPTTPSVQPPQSTDFAGQVPLPPMTSTVASINPTAQASVVSTGSGTSTAQLPLVSAASPINTSSNFSINSPSNI